jgi:aminopeptidase N
MSLAPRESHSIESIAFDKIDPTRARRDPYAKGAMVLHTLRYLLGEDAFFELLRRHAYPDAGERDGRRVRLESSDGFARRAKDVCGVDLTWFFEVYLRQKELPRLCIDRSLTELRLWWEAPSGLPFPMPVELEINGSRQRVSMPEFGETVIATNGRNAVVDPDWWILRDDAPDPDCFGTLGLQAVSLDDAIKSGR